MDEKNRNQNAVNVFDKLAQVYEDKFMNVDLYENSFLFFCDKVPGINVIDIACGPGNITRHLLRINPTLKIIGFDLSPRMIELAIKNNPNAQFKLQDCRDLNTLDKQSDGIICGFLFPYLSKEESIQFINGSYSALNDNGLLYISTMEDDYDQSGLTKGSSGDEIFMHYHEESYLKEALLKVGFRILKTERIITNPSEGVTVTDLILIAQRLS